MITTNIIQAQQALIDDEIIAIPTETVYGLAGNAYSESALRKIFQLKKRPFYNPLIVHIKSAEYLYQIAREIPEPALKLAKAFWPGPLTLVLKKQTRLPDLVTAGKDTVAIRMPNHPVALALLDKLEFPLAAPSANPFGSISPTCAKHVWNYFGEDLGIILEGGECSRGLESTIIGFNGQQAVLYRLGAIPVEEIEPIVGKLEIAKTNDHSPSSPGMLSQHYAPSTPTYTAKEVSKLLHVFEDKKIGVLLFRNAPITPPDVVKQVLSEKGDLNEAAHNLYAALHYLDTCKLDALIVEEFPDIGLGKTINDRLKRASVKVQPDEIRS